MGSIYVNVTYHLPDSDDQAAAENELADKVARSVGTTPEITSASFSSDTTGLINLHDRFANLAAQEPADHPAEAGPAADGVGTGEIPPGSNRKKTRGRK